MAGGSDYVYFKKDTGRAFTREEFLRYVERRVQRTINRYRLFKPDDRIAVAVSGGKDSMTLLHILEKIERNYPSELVVVHLDEGIRGYSDVASELVRRKASEMGLEYYEASYKNLFGFTMDEVASVPRGERRFGACTFCGVWRRWGLNYLAHKAGATKLATAHCLDDEAQTVLMNVMRGSLSNVLRLRPDPSSVDPRVVPRVKPFREIPEREITLYAHLAGIEYVDVPCPYAREGMRWDIRRFLYEQEEKSPGVMYGLVRFAERLIRIFEDEGIYEKFVKRPSRCKICGLPSAGEYCKAHELQMLMQRLLGERSR